MGGGDEAEHDSGVSSRRWRSVAAVLANEHTRVMIAHLILGEKIAGYLETYSPSKRTRIVTALVNADVVRQGNDGDYVLNSEIFRELLAHEPAQKPVGIERFFRDGRLHTYPASPVERRELLDVIAARTLAPGEVVPERVINERLSAFTDDVAVLRRYLVDFELVERRRDGSEYSLAP